MNPPARKSTTKSQRKSPRKASAASRDGKLSALDARNFRAIALESLRVKVHLHLLLWLGGEFQNSVPHQIFIAAWGDFPDGRIEYDVVSAIPLVRTGHFTSGDIAPVIRDLFAKWSENGSSPIGMQFRDGVRLPLQHADAAERAELRAFRLMHSAAVHGITDARGKQNCLYMFLNEDPGVSTSTLENLRVLLPFVDAASRRVAHLPNRENEIEPAAEPAAVQDAEPELSGRELHIMDWVRAGKTNHEIGLILDISAFTVKNHLQRIFRKLDVTNRAQAVSRYQQLRKGSAETAAKDVKAERGGSRQRRLATEKS